MTASSPKQEGLFQVESHMVREGLAEGHCRGFSGTYDWFVPVFLGICSRKQLHTLWRSAILMARTQKGNGCIQATGGSRPPSRPAGPLQREWP